MYEDLKIIHYPDPRLRKAAASVTAFDDDLRALIARMFELMREDRGVGLAAPQVGISKRLFVMNDTGEPEDDLVVINPVLTEGTGNETDEEGCLSLPGIRAQIDRSKTLTLTAQNATGGTFTQTETGYLARIWQHETDHLNGIMLIDRMGFVAKSAVKKKLKALEEDYAEALPKRK